MALARQGRHCCAHSCAPGDMAEVSKQWVLVDHLFDPLVRSLSDVIPPSLRHVGCFADDLACGVRDVVVGLH